MDPVTRLDAQGRTIRRTRTPEEILADLPPYIKEVRRILREGGDPGPMPIDHLVYFGGKRHQELIENRPDYFGISPPDFDIDRPQDLTVAGSSLLMGPMPTAMVKVRTKYGEVFVDPKDLSLAPQETWKTKPGIQIITGNHGPDCCCVCCCCPERQPEIFYKPDDCGVCQISEDLTIGVFIDGQSATSSPEEWWKGHVPASGIRDLCSRYPHEKWLYVGWWGPIKTRDLAKEIFERLREEICKRSWWDRDAGTWRSCHKVTIDLFGYSRGAATAVKVAANLNEAWDCEKCPEALPRGPAHVRFLGTIDPYGQFVSGVDVLPANVQYFYSAYSGNDRSWTQIASRWKSEHFTEKERKVDAGNVFPLLDHEEMDDYEKAPMERLRGAFEDMTGEKWNDAPPRDAEDRILAKFACTVLNKPAEPEELKK